MMRANVKGQKPHLNSGHIRGESRGCCREMKVRQKEKIQKAGHKRPTQQRKSQWEREQPASLGTEITQSTSHAAAARFLFTPSSPFLLSYSRYSHADSAGRRGSHDHATGPRGGAERPRVPALPLAPTACARAQRVERCAAPRGALPRPVCGWALKVQLLWLHRGSARSCFCFKLSGIYTYCAYWMSDFAEKSRGLKVIGKCF